MQWYELRTEEIENILQREGLKRWWVAEFSGVHVTTFRRWMNGRIRQVSERNVERLSRVLETPKCVISYPVCHHKNPAPA